MLYGILQSIHDENGNLVDGHDQWYEPSLHDGVKALFATRTSEVDGIDLISSSYNPHGKRLVVYVSNNMEFRTGLREARSLHLMGVSASSARRLCKLLKVDIAL